MANSNMYFIIVTGGLLICGTFNSLIAKLIYGLTSTGESGVVHNFRKPWFQTTNMFVGMVLCLPMYHLKMYCLAKQAKRKTDPEAVPLISPVEQTPEEANASSPMAVLFPAMADLLATGLMMTGLVFTSASVYQMLRGAEVVFCAILSVIFLKMHLDKYMKAGILLTVLGISLVGCASLLGDSSADSNPIADQMFGIGLILLSQLIQAAQMISEEFLLQDIKMDALVLAGYEGVWGSLLCLLVCLPLWQMMPGSDHGHLEDSYDSILMLSHSSAIVFAEVMNCLSVLSYNYFGLTVTQDFTAMHRVIIEASRSLLVWIADLLIHYFTGGKFGERWDWTSWVQLAGFCVLLLGTVVYNYTTFLVETHLDELADELGGWKEEDGHRTISSASRASRGSTTSTRSNTSSRRPRF